VLLSEDLPGCLVVLKAISELIEDHDRQVPVAHTTRLDSRPVGHLRTNPHVRQVCARGLRKRCYLRHVGVVVLDPATILGIEVKRHVMAVTVAHNAAHPVLPRALWGWSTAPSAAVRDALVSSSLCAALIEHNFQLQR